MMARESLLNLRTAAVAMHVAKAAYVHQDVKLELLPGVEAPQKLIVPPAMPHAQVDNLAALLCRERLHPLRNLPVRVMAGRINQCCGNFYFQWPIFHQINDPGTMLKRHAFHQVGGRMLQFGSRLAFVCIGICIFHQRRRKARGSQKLLLGLRAQIRIRRLDLFHQRPHGFRLNVIRRFRAASFSSAPRWRTSA